MSDTPSFSDLLNLFLQQYAKGPDQAEARKSLAQLLGVANGRELSAFILSGFTPPEELPF